MALGCGPLGGGGGGGGADTNTAVETGSTGWLSGGILSVGTGSDDFTISAGTIQFVTAAGVYTDVTFAGATDTVVTNIGIQNITFVGVDASSTVIQQATQFTNIQTRTIAVVGVVVHVDRVNVDVVNIEQQIAYNANSQIYDLATSMGFFNDSGNIFSANGANLTINKSLGAMFKAGSNIDTSASNPHVKSLPALTGLTFQYRYNDGSNGATGTGITPDVYDDGAGGTTAVGNNQWSVQRIYSFVSNNVKIQLDVTDYASLDAAVNGIQASAYFPEPSIAANGLLRAWLVVKKGTTDLSGSDALFLQAPKFSGSSSAGGASVTDLQEAYLNSTPNPEILTDATNGALQIRRGSAADSDSVFEVQNNAGTANVTIAGTGDITSTGQIFVPGGSVSAASFAASGDQHTGVYFPAGDVVGVTTGGALRLSVTNARSELANILSYGFDTELTIASGAVTITHSHHTIDTQSDAASDDLDTITGGADGDVLIIRPANTARTVVVLDSGNILVNGGRFSMDHIEDSLTLLHDGSNWNETGRSDKAVRATIAASEIDFSQEGARFQTMSGNTTFTIVNPIQGKVVSLRLSGNFTVTYPAAVEEINGAYDGAKTNAIMIYCEDAAAPRYWVTTLQEP